MNNNFSEEELIEKYGPMISKLSYRMIQNESIAKEAAQEAWLEILKSLSSFKGLSKISTWVYTIAKRTIWKYIKKEITYTEKMVDDYFSLDEIPCPHDSIAEKKVWVKEQCDRCFTAGYHCLTNEARIEKILVDIVGLTYSEVSKIINKSGETIRKSINRSRIKIKNFMDKNCAIFNSEATCRCRIKKTVNEVDLSLEYQKIKKEFKDKIIPQILEKLVPEKNYIRNSNNR